MSDANRSVIRYQKNATGTYASPPVGTRATATFRITTNPVQGQAVIVNTVTYIFESTLLALANRVKIGATTAISLANLVAAINAESGGSGVKYGASTTANAYASAEVSEAVADGMTVILTAKSQGTAPNAYPLVGLTATGKLTLTGLPVNNETTTVRARVYTWKGTLTGAANEVKIGGTAAASVTNFIAAINAGASAGTNYGTGTVAHADVVAYQETGLVAQLYAKADGTAPNSYATTTTLTNGTFAAATLTGGVAGFTAATFSGGLAATLAMQQVRFNSESLKYEKVTVRTEEIRADRSVGDLIKVGIGMSGGTEHELYTEDFEPLLNSGLMGVAASGSEEQTCDLAANGTITTSLSAWTESLLGARWIKISGSAVAANNGIYRVLSAVDGTIVIDGTFSATTGEDITINFSYCRNGTQLDDYILEKEIVEPASFTQFLGSCVDSMKFSIEAQKKAMLSFTFLGYGGEERPDSVAATSEDPSPQSDHSILTGSNNMGTLRVRGSQIAAPAQSLMLQVANNLRKRLALGQQGTLKPGAGNSDVTGSITVYFDERTLYRRFINDDAVSAQFHFLDNSGRLFGVYLPRIKFPDANPNVPGINQDVMLPLTFQATKYPDDDTGYQVQFDYIN